jgi:uncharacterized membrane protein YhaH (DUF805 family)
MIVVLLVVWGGWRAKLIARLNMEDLMNKPVGFGRALVLFFKKYVDFTGRSTRAEYWWLQLWKFIYGIIIYGVIIASIPIMLVSFEHNTLTVTQHTQWFLVFFLIVLLVALVVGLGTIIPNISLLVRRYRDAGVNPLLVLVPYVLPNLASVFIGLPAATLADETTSSSLLAMAGWRLIVLLLISVGTMIFNLVITLMPSKLDRPASDEDDQNY